MNLCLLLLHQVLRGFLVSLVGKDSWDLQDLQVSWNSQVISC